MAMEWIVDLVCGTIELAVDAAKGDGKPPKRSRFRRLLDGLLVLLAVGLLLGVGYLAFV